jgi:hypothetical protein
MKSTLLASALAGTALLVGAALADTQHPHPDANGDGFISRAEAEAAASRLFDRLDADKNGKLDDADRAALREKFKEHRKDRMEARKERREARQEAGPGAPPSPAGPPGADGHAGPGGRGFHRGGGPMGMRLLAHPGEADRNGDGALSKQEFVTQELRFFDALDANGDGKIEAPRKMDRDPPAPPPR